MKAYLKNGHHTFQTIFRGRASHRDRFECKDRDLDFGITNRGEIYPQMTGRWGEDYGIS